MQVKGRPPGITTSKKFYEDFRWLPVPNWLLVTFHFNVTGDISFKIKCTDDEECGKNRTWFINESADVSQDVDIKRREFMIDHPAIRLLATADEINQARKIAMNKFIQQAALYAIDPTTWCLLSSQGQ